MYKPKKYLLKTYGCQMNVHDSEQIMASVEALGYESADSLEEADLFIINSCSVRQAAEDSVYGWGKKMKNMGNKPFVILTGCVVGSGVGDRKRYTMEYIKRKIPWVDLFVPSDELHVIPSRIAEERPAVPNAVSYKRGRGRRAWVNVSVGCDNFCTFCVVPYSRGREISRSEEEILKEVRESVKAGYCEITLLGQNVNSWGLSRKEKFKIRAGSAQRLPFADLIRKLCAVDGIKKIDFMSSNPFDFTLDLVDALKHPKVSRYIHIALQSGDDKILKAMGRRHTAEDFISLVRAIRSALPDVEIGTDLIVGFPGETKDQFGNTVRVCKEIGFSNAYISMYSERKGTKGALLDDDIPLEEKRRRHAVLTRVIKESKTGGSL